jgi:release factor glutamine methyltransferase
MKNISTLALIPDIEHKLATIYPDPVLCAQYAWWIMQAITQRTQQDLLLNNPALSPEQHAELTRWLHALINDKKPIQYLIGSVPFCDLEIVVQPPILIPRPETEEWCIDLIQELKKMGPQYAPLTILDLCCGSGCIALALAKALPHATVYATDIDSAALTLARQNTTHNNVNNIIFVQSDVCDELPNVRFDLIVANPPYITPQEYVSLDASVKNWESKHALMADDNGLAIIKKIIAQAPHFIKPNKQLQEHNIPQLVLEIGYLQADAVVDLLAAAGYNSIEIRKDLAGHNRTVRARLNR